MFFLDADEAMTSEVIEELASLDLASEERGFGMAYVRRRDFFQDRWIRRSSGYPTWFGRLCHSDFVTVEREINEEYQCSLSTIRLRSHIDHWPFAKGLPQWFDRHNRYSTMEGTRLLGLKIENNEYLVI